MKKVLGAVALLVSVVLVAVVSVGLWERLRPGYEDESRTTQVIQAVTKEEQVVLVSLRMQGITQDSRQAKAMGHGVPGTRRTTLLQYSFNAKLGIEGGDVKVVETGPNAYRVTIPDFIFIGHDEASFKTVVEDNGLISLVTPEIDTAEMVSKVLDDSSKEQYVHSNREVLQDQAEAFYTGIIKGVDPEATVTLEFQTDPTA